MWITEPLKNQPKPTVPLLRPKAGGSVKAVLQGEPLRCYVHFASGRSWPCTVHHCSLCKRSIPKRLYAYYPVSGQQGCPGILELTATTDYLLSKQLDEYSQVAAGMVLVRRKPGKRNNPCVIEYTEHIEEEYRGGSGRDLVDLKNQLFRIWNLPLRNGETTEKEYLERVAETIRLRTTKKGESS